MVLLQVLCLGILAACDGKSPPHIVIVTADDLGWADTSLVGSEQVPTPNLEALAANGILLNHHYTLQTCTPSRAALLTGLYPIRMGLQQGVMLPAQPGGLDPTIPTIAERLQSLDYVTHALGKWHLGYSSVDYLPTRRGFDTFFGYYNMAKYYFKQKLNFYSICGHDYWDNETLVSSDDGAYDTHYLTDRAVEIISRHNTNKPLFMYLATLAAHGQADNLTADAPESNLEKFSYIGDRNRTLLAGAVDVLDESVGRVIEALHKRRMLANSVVVFTSDNGGMPWGTYSNTGSNWPLRGTKGTLWEGGIRVPAVVWSPLLKPGSRVVVPGMMHVVDWLPTLYSAAGGCTDDLGEIDGLDLWPALSTAKHSSHQTWLRNEFLVNVDASTGMAAYREGGYKLLSVTKPSSTVSANTFGDPALQKQVPIPGGMPPHERGETATQRLNELMTSSLAWRTLEQFYAEGGGHLNDLHSGWRKRASVRCGLNKKSTPGLEELREGYYLFDIDKDPCELRDLVTRLPSVVSEMSQKLDAYVAVARQPLDLFMEEEGLPDVNDCVWAPWKDRAQTAACNCSCR